MNEIPDSLRRVLANIGKPKAPIKPLELRGDVTTILDDGTIYRTKPDGKIIWLPDIAPISRK